MKKLIYFLLFSTVGFAQNYQYALGEATAKTAVVPQGVNNQLEEIEYFKAYLLPIEKKATLQQALDTYGAVRLGKGDYSGVDIVVKSNQRLYGHPSLTQVGNITIAAGSTGVILQDLFPFDKNVTFQAGGVISNCTLKTIKWAKITGINVKLENNLFLNITSSINLDCSSSGYFRNNKIIKFMVHGGAKVLVMKGNNITPSYGNVNFHSNFLGQSGDATDISGIQSSTFVGVDAEAWNNQGLGTGSLMSMQNMGNVKITDFGGGSGGYTKGAPSYNIDATNLTFFHKYINPLETGNNTPTLSPRTNLLYFEGEHDDYLRDYNKVVGFDLKAHFGGNDIFLNGIAQNSFISNTALITNAIIDTQCTPWARPTWESLPDPLGPSWATDRIGKKDDTAYIQNLINSNGIAELPIGVFYISSTLKMIVDNSHGITGQGTGKTVLVGLTDDFPLITLSQTKETSGSNFILSNLTLQGGSTGIYAPDEIDLVATTNFKYLVFRNQKKAIHLYRIFGLDNCFFDSVSFVDCSTGFFQDPDPVYTLDNAGYVDKVVFYNGQYINCGTAFSMLATRSNNMNAWINCKFDGNNKAMTVGANNFIIAANCDFANHKSRAATGNWTTNNYAEDSVIEGNMSLYSCNFYNNNTSFTFNSVKTYMEGCNLLDNNVVFSDKLHHTQNKYILNSTITGPIGGGLGINNGFFVNSNLLRNPEFSQTFVNLKGNVSTTIIKSTPNPCPQFLVTQ